MSIREVTRYIMEIIKDVLSATLKLESEEVSAILFEQLIEQRKETLQNYLHEKEFLRGTVAEMVCCLGPGCLGSSEPV